MVGTKATDKLTLCMKCGGRRHAEEKGGGGGRAGDKKELGKLTKRRKERESDRKRSVRWYKVRS